MVKVLFLFPATADTSAVDAFLKDKWAAGVKAQRGVRSVSVSAGALMGGRGLPYGRVAEVTFDALGDAMAARESQSGQTADRVMRDLGATILMFETLEF
ncbi:MAG TPA: hypothetical protein VFM93_03995 [Candidatus Limnocylindria bacterium]|nr:hypothetical protein [Candidatus Limnocylindria bacterium]